MLLEYNIGDDMKKRFYISIFIILSLTVVVLSATYSKDSGTSEYTSISKEVDNMKVTFENGELLSIDKVNKLNAEELKGSNISIVNKNKTSTNALIDINYNGDAEVYYSIDGAPIKLIDENAKEVVNLKPFGEVGDQILINVKVFSKKDINDRVAIRVSSIQEDGLKYTMVNSNQVYKDGEGNYIYYGKPNNYIKYNDSVYRIIGLINNKFKLVRFNESLEEYNENNNYITIRDFLRTFNNREVDESNMDLFDTWLKEYNNYWFSDGDVFIDNTINIEKLGSHISNEVLELGDYVLLSNGDGTINNPYEVKYGS